MQYEVEVPEEAVEAAFNAGVKPWRPRAEREDHRRTVREMLQAAAPPIHKQAIDKERERARELIGRDMPIDAGLLGEAATDLSDYACERDDPTDERRLLTMAQQLRELDAVLVEGDSPS